MTVHRFSVGFDRCSHRLCHRFSLLLMATNGAKQTSASLVNAESGRLTRFSLGLPSI